MRRLKRAFTPSSAEAFLCRRGAGEALNNFTSIIISSSSSSVFLLESLAGKSTERGLGLRNPIP